MPYIKNENRSKYDAIIEKVMGLIPSNESPMIQATLVATFSSSLIREIKRLADPKFPNTTITGMGAKLKEYATELARTLPANKEDMAGDLNYSLSSLCWGLTGDAPGRLPAKYCMRSFIKGALWRAVMSQREFYTPEECIFFLGVFTDVIDEMYRRRTAPYEDLAIEKSGDLWLETPA